MCRTTYTARWKFYDVCRIKMPNDVSRMMFTEEVCRIKIDWCWIINFFTNSLSNNPKEQTYSQASEDLILSSKNHAAVQRNTNGSQIRKTTKKTFRGERKKLITSLDQVRTCQSQRPIFFHVSYLRSLSEAHFRFRWIIRERSALVRTGACAHWSRLSTHDVGASDAVLLFCCHEISTVN